MIDVTKEQASDRIERAKLKRRDIAQKVETLITSGVQAFDRGDRNAARESFSQLLQLDPHNSTAQEHMDKLTEVGVEAGAAGLPTADTTPKPAAPPPPPRHV